jgi:hypothetical protein
MAQRFIYPDLDEDIIDDRLMIPMEAMELAVRGGWDMADFVSDLKGENGAESKEVAEAFCSSGGFALLPNFWNVRIRRRPRTRSPAAHDVCRDYAAARCRRWRFQFQGRSSPICLAG